MSRSFLFDCRAAANRCSDLLISKLLRDRTDELQAALNILHDAPNANNMKRVVAYWTRAQKALEKATPMPNPTPRAGAGEVERMAA